MTGRMASSPHRSLAGTSLITIVRCCDEPMLSR